MKYFRSYPWGIQFFFFLMMIITMLGFGSFMVYTLLPKFTGIDITLLAKVDEQSPIAVVNATLIEQAILNLFIFLVPALMFSYLTHPEPARYLGLRAPGKKIQWALVIGIMLGAMPVLQLIEGLIGQINFGVEVKAKQAANDSIMNAFLNMPTFSAFLRTFFVIAIIPAFGEEMFFRGVMLRFARQRSRNMVFPVLFTAAIFSYSHTNIYGYLSIFLAGILLAVIYNLTGSLWCSILAHLFFNGFQVILGYMSNSNVAMKAFMNNSSVLWYLVAGGAIVFSVSFYLLLKNKTPLPLNWSDNFTPEELSQQQTI